MNSSHWPVVPIKELYLALYDGPHATPKPSDVGPVFLGIGNLTDNGHLDLNEVRHIAEEDFSQWTRRVTPRPGDIVFTYEATLNRYAIIPDGFRGCLGRRLALIRPNPGKVDTRFLHYYFFGEQWRETVAKNTLIGSTVDRIPLTHFPNFSIFLPPLHTQHNIAAILSAYDDLIENNTRRIKILEEMAQLIYREWFINLRFPGHEKAKMVESEFGPIPEGWIIQTISDVAAVNESSIENGRAPKEIGYINIGSVSTGRVLEIELLPFDQAPGRARRKVKHGDIIWSAVRPNLRAYALILNPASNLIVSTGFAVITPKAVPFSFLYLGLTTEEFVSYLVNHARGAAYPAVNTEDFENARIVVPDSQLLELFHNQTANLLALMHSLLEQIRNLRKTRNLLLPKLISGEIDVECLNIIIPAKTAEVAASTQ